MKKKEKKRIKKALLEIVDGGFATPTDQVKAAKLLAKHF